MYSLISLNYKVWDYDFIEKTKKEFISREVTKGERRMPWLLAAKKDAVSCENVRGSANGN